MLRPIFILAICLFFFREAFAQKKDTLVYYLKNSGKVVSSKDSADFFLVILPPDTSVDKDLFIVKEFYPNGRLKLISGSKTNNLEKLKFQGSYMAFYPNGHKMLIGNYEKGRVIGDEIEYYPNGKLYNIKSYLKAKKVYLKQYNDSIGNVLAENGKGKWKEFSEGFKVINAEGEIDNGVETGTWHGRINDSVEVESEFIDGKLVATSRLYAYKYSPGEEIFNKVDTVAEFPGGPDAFGAFCSRNMRYPAIARENGIQGKVIVSFIVEKDGMVSNIKVLRGIGDGCDEETVRVIKMSPLWKPAMLNGKPVRGAHSVSASFSMSGNQCSIKIINDPVDFVNKDSNDKDITLESLDVADKDTDPGIFTSVDLVPEFPGGLDAFIKFLAHNIRYPARAKENNIQGRVIVSFVVERDGTLTNVKVARGIGGGCDEEAVRVMKLCPPWKPGIQNGKAVRVAYSLPIAFYFE